MAILTASSRMLCFSFGIPDFPNKEVASSLTIRNNSSRSSSVIVLVARRLEWSPAPPIDPMLLARMVAGGLSFDEIANVRNTKEKTVRQQATAIYRKSGLGSRHEFAAWFFEDFL